MKAMMKAGIKMGTIFPHIVSSEAILFDRSLVEAVQGIALSSVFRVPFTQISENFVILLEFCNKS